MLFEQSLAIAHRAVMALDEDVTDGLSARVAATTPAAENGRGLTERIRVGSPSIGKLGERARAIRRA